MGFLRVAASFNKLVAIFLALIAIQAVVLDASAMPLLDTSFGSNGTARIGVPGGASDTPSASVLQSDGKLLVAGGSAGSRQSYAFVLRFLPNGTLDATFGQNGVVFIDPPIGKIYSIQQLEQSTDGSILISGSTGVGFVLTQLTAGGVLDTDFGTQGFFSVGQVTSGTPARFVQQSDGSLMLVSDATQESQFALRLIRLTRAGVRDSAYALNGEKVLTNLPLDFVMASGRSVAAGPNGGFTVMANATFKSGTYLLLQMNATGALDSSFGAGGLASGDHLGNPFDKPTEIVRTFDGKLLLLGNAADATGNQTGNIVLWRVTTDGVSDPFFGTSGRLEIGSGYSSYGLYNQLATLANGDIVFSEHDSSGRTRVRRFNASGMSDSGFGIDGSALIALSGYARFASTSVIANGAGGLLVPAAATLKIECYVSRPCTSVGVDVAIASLDSSGHLQTSYGRGDGFAAWNNPQFSYDHFDTILIESSGKVMLAGSSDAGATFDYLLARLTENGLPDSLFGTSGRVSPNKFAHFLGTIRAVEQENGAITVVAGTAAGSFGQIGTVTAFRLNSAGTVDAGFVPELALPQMPNMDIALGVRPDGRLLYGTSSGESAILQQKMPDGTADPIFGTGGNVIFPFSAGEHSRQADLLVLGDGSVAFAVLTTQNLRIYKVDSHGLPVGSFGTAGQFSYAAAFDSAAAIGNPFTLLALADGSMLVGIRAFAPTGSSTESLLAIRVSGTGMLIAADNLLADQRYLTWSFAALPDASVVIARNRWLDDGTKSAALYRLLPDNNFDLSFGEGGAYPLPGTQVDAIAFDSNRRLLVAGQDSTSATLKRYTIENPTNGAAVIEFYNTSLDHYFITADAAEASAIDHGSAGPGWSRTGNSFKSGGISRVCRFYGSVSPGPNSHFYTVIASECAGLKQQQASTPATLKRWNFESYDFHSTVPITRSTTGELYCPNGLVPVYRAYNNGFVRGIDSNHRISSNAAAIQEVVNRGWINEGVVMCAPI